MSVMRRIAAAAVLLTLTLDAGCHHAGTIPPGWHGEPLSLVDDQQPQPTGTEHPDQGNGDTRGSTAQLQVFICYGKVLSNHTALRLSAPGKEALMWDPGGTYKQYDPSYARRHDVLTKNSVTVNQWWRYRRDGCYEPIMEVFQWSLAPDLAQRLRAILLERQDPDDPGQTFEPDAGGLQCSKRVSEFLMRFADGRPVVDKKYFWPHELGEHLWTQQPDRVMVFRSNGDNHVYRRNAESTAAE